MHLLPREEAKLALHQAGFLAQKRLARGVRLNVAEATALLATVLHELIRDGTHSVADLMARGKRILGRQHCQPCVPRLLHEIQVEGAFPDGVFLVTVHDPVCSLKGDIHTALYSSFLPVPDPSAFSQDDELLNDADVPGALVLAKDKIELNPGRRRVKLKVSNTGDRPVQVGSHFHFAESNKALSFDRAQAFFMRLDVPAGTAVRFEPGDSKSVTLVEIAGEQRVTGGNLVLDGLSRAMHAELGGEAQSRLVARLVERGFAHAPQQQQHNTESMLPPFEMSREAYASMYGPTTGDKVRLADTDLWITVERDMTSYGDELKFGGGKVIREGMGQATGLRDAESLDLVITNALIVDWSGIYKADIGINKHRIVGIGKAGNPDVMHNVTKGMVIGVNTEVIAGEKLIVTAGGIDAHVHYICPQQWQEAMASGLTTMIGGGTGPSAGTSATTCTPAQTHIQMMLSATDGIPLNFAFTGKGNDAGPAGLEDQIRAGCAGLKLHEVR